MLTRPFSRLVVAFGARSVTSRRLVEEVVLGLGLIFPIGIVAGALTIRLCCKGNVLEKYIRSDLWTTLVVFLVGDVLMELLLPSLQCLPDEEQSRMNHQGLFLQYDWDWLMQSYGINCPATSSAADSSSEQQQLSSLLLSPDATACLFTLRLFFLCLGVYLGEGFFPIALTGGIACGKTTVAQLLVDYNTAPVSSTNHSNSSNSNHNNSNHSNSNNHRRNKNNKRASFTASNSQSNLNSSTVVAQDEKEGTIYLVCADAIAHEILLPPQLLAQGVSEDGVEFTVSPRDSVYSIIVDKFGTDILMESSSSASTSSDDEEEEDRDEADIPPLIDRRALGSIIFNDPAKRRVLNSITHPRILTILVKRLFYGLFWSQHDLCVADVPLLFESGMLTWLFGITICVAVSDPSVQLSRLMRRNPDIPKDECQARMDSQMSLEKKCKLADMVLLNDTSPQDLSDQVENVRRELMARIYGIGMSLVQMLLLIGGSTAIAISSKFYGKWQS